MFLILNLNSTYNIIIIVLHMILDDTFYQRQVSIFAFCQCDMNISADMILYNTYNLYVDVKRLIRIYIVHFDPPPPPALF